MNFIKYLFKREVKDKPLVEGGDDWQARMGWRYVTYIENDATLSCAIEPMAHSADRVVVPDESAWVQHAPVWARRRRSEILSRLKSLAWNRRLLWHEGGHALSQLGPTLDKAIPGTIESMADGRELESQRLFEPDSHVSVEEAKEMWIAAVRFQAKIAKGPVKIYMPEDTPGSILQEIVIPTLRANPDVILVLE